METFAHLRKMKLIRAFEEALAAYPEHGFQLLSSGEEAVAVGLCAALVGDDQLLTGGRSIGPALARGVAPNQLMAELLGKKTGTNSGKGGRGHLADPQSGFFGAHAVVGGNISIAAGVALSMQMLNKGSIVAILFGDGAFGAGPLHETLNIAASLKLPLLFVCNNNQLSVSTPRAEVLAPKNLSDIGAAFRMPAQTMDGMDVRAVEKSALKLVAGVRAGEGPAFLECMSYRFSSHSTNARETRSREELARIRALCPIIRERAQLTAEGVFNPQTEAWLDDEVASAIAEIMNFAESSAFPHSDEALTDVC